jgi:hypothetical protein
MVVSAFVDIVPMMNAIGDGNEVFVCLLVDFLSVVLLDIGVLCS